MIILAIVPAVLVSAILSVLYIVALLFGADDTGGSYE